LTVEVNDLKTAAQVVALLHASDLFTVMRTKNRFDVSYNAFAIGGHVAGF
jgi:hypothetical protein